MYINVEQRNWDSILPFVTFAYNSVKQDTTGLSAFFLIHCRNIETLPDVILPHGPENHCDSYVRQLITRAEEARELAKLNIMDAQSSDKKRYKRHLPVIIMLVILYGSSLQFEMLDTSKNSLCASSVITE
ncbi:uncharacterized protein TNCV_2388651 [Trichonephila clavipes]|nr:uncharacterized protein TNCV_2388651 [Trichonephila clavipes]